MEEADFEKTNDDARERSFMLVVVLLIISVAVHIGLMLSVSDYSFTPLVENIHADRKLTKDLPTMQMQKYEGDPLAEVMRDVPRPAPAPEEERQSDRVERLSGDVTGGIAPEMPESPASILPPAQPDVAPRTVEAAEWQPRQDILTVPEPVVPDVHEALPRVVKPKVERVSHAADITLAADFDLLKSTESTAFAASSDAVHIAPNLAPGKEGGGAPGSAVAPAAPRAAPPRAPGKGASSSSALSGAGAPPALTILSEAEEAQKRREAAEVAAAKKVGKTVEQMRAEKLAEEAAKAAKPPPAPPAMARVDEAIVAQEKAAVRRLRDERATAGRPFDRNVIVRLGFWIDPQNPARKYFRVRVASNPLNPLPIVSKDIVFLLDASGSIGNDRLRSCRNAVLEALDRLNTGDRFNVVAFRDKFAYAFPDTAWREVDVDSVEQARSWLSKLKAHGNTDVFRTLRSVLTLPRDPARPIVAFVATDGDATSGMTRSAEIISRFSELNGGLVSIFMYGVKPEANAYLMDMLTRCNRGGWACHKGLRWLAAQGVPEMSKMFEKPVLTDVAVIFSASSRAETYPKLVTNLCEGEPIEIYGVCPADQKDLVFQMRGLNAVTAFESMFTLPFASAEKLDGEVRVAWATRRLYELIAEYTRKPSKQLLADIHSFAAAYGIAVPYEKEMKK